MSMSDETYAAHLKAYRADQKVKRAIAEQQGDVDAATHHRAAAKAAKRGQLLWTAREYRDANHALAHQSLAAEAGRRNALLDAPVPVEG